MLNSYQYGKLWNAVQAADPTNTNIDKKFDLFQYDELEAMKSLKSPEEVARLRAAGYECRAWGIVDSDAMIRAVEKGFDGGMTVNFPDKLTAYLNNRK